VTDAQPTAIVAAIGAQVSRRAEPAPIPLTRPSMGPDELAAVAQVFESGWLAGQGPRGTALEEDFTRLTGRAHAVAVNNCTAGLHLALSGLGITAGDEVLVADYSFPATGHAVLYCGATPVFVDVRDDTGTIDTDLLKPAITPRTKAIVAVDALGMPADWDALTAFADAHELLLVEDAACSAGGSYRGRPCGGFGDVAVFSLHARKGITCGEGGVLVTDDADLAARVRAAANFGMRSAFDRQGADTLVLPSFSDIGYNYKLSDILAAIASVQVSQLETFIRQRQEIARRYHELLAGISGITAPDLPTDRVATWQTYAVRVRPPLRRDALIMGLRAEGIGAQIGTYAMHREPVYGPTAGPCPVSGELFEQHLALPMYPGLTGDDQERVVLALARLVSLG
jgi:dTDP-4-amino-4,6-dideoxygalactose transaminase